MQVFDNYSTQIERIHLKLYFFANLIERAERSHFAQYGCFYHCCKFSSQMQFVILILAKKDPFTVQKIYYKYH